ncbi:MAG: hypothetical protein OEZ01_01915, partial [Candidatus Heimdallarchaeota archaeon]|nr:hypothetical protein [Candidatus Heimdallarchaeota archaeon]
LEYSYYIIEILEDSPVDNDVSTTQGLFLVNDTEGDTYLSDGPEFPLLPLEITFSDSSVMYFEEVVNYFFDNSTINCNSIECTVETTETYPNFQSTTTVVYNIEFGALVDYYESVTMDNNSYIAEAVLTTDLDQFRGPQVNPVSMIYYNGFTQNQIFEWNITRTNSTGTEDYQYKIEIMTNSPVDNDFNSVQGLFKVTDSEGDTYLTDGPEFPLLPVQINFDDSSSWNFEDILIAYFEGASISCNAQTCTVTYTENYISYSASVSITYDAQKGLLLDFYADVTDNGENYIEEAYLITNNPSNSSSSDSNANGFSLSYNPWFGLTIMIAVPFITKKKRN